MSRRNRNKKKKQKIQKKVDKLTNTEETFEVEADEKRTDESERADKNQEQSIIDQKTRKLISKDVKVILLTMLLLAAILTTIKILQLRTDLIDNFGNWLVQILNIHTT